MVGVRTTSMLQIGSGINFTLSLHWLPTQIQVFPQCFPSGNLCCNGKCLMDCSVPMPSSAAHLPDPIPFLGASINYRGACAFLSLLTEIFFCVKQVKELVQGQLVLYSCPAVRSMSALGT